MWRRDNQIDGHGATAAPTPRDVEALERVIEALDADVSDEVDAHARIRRDSSSAGDR